MWLVEEDSDERENGIREAFTYPFFGQQSTTTTTNWRIFLIRVLIGRHFDGGDGDLWW